MSHPFIFARTTPQKPAVIMAESGRSLSFAELEDRANRTAHLLRSLGIQRGDCVAAMLENGIDMFDIACAAERIGVYFTAVSSKLTAAEGEYIVRDSGSKAFFTSPQVGAVADELAGLLAGAPLFMTAPASGPYRDWDKAASEFPPSPVPDESAGGLMLYSSGTTGRPKGIKRPLPETGILTMPFFEPLFTRIYGASQDSVYLCPAPLYHAAPLNWALLALRVGCTVVVMEKFDEEAVLKAIEQYKVTIAQFVPTHFIRMLKLPEENRAKYDVSSLKTVFHAAAPCPVPIKQAMIDWLGPIVHEYYSGTEGNGITIISPEEWLKKKGSVGRAMNCTLFACDENGEPLPVGETGQIFFAGGNEFEYHNDREKTLDSRNTRGWTSLGDVGYVDEDGYLFLTDRKSFMIISGGVNIYPQEIENLLVTHPKIADVAVIGAPDPDMGEKVVAVVQPADMSQVGPELAEDIRLFCREHLSGVKVPRQVDFVEELPRHPTGKLYKRLVRDQYWSKTLA
ncbi:o-succinylbenzoate--CoA ligase [Sphingobium chlorophenolicum L-1]|uniref:O-succinylbenzoate--CoA ligase n=1 Tax=Sphingobium chlorophenolicum L-1 TaxID=690566 RepID=F6EUH1_SPHCR|nr:acyl-CoA synthetase [Sphingobium chlorophenolicum]AEG47865.1 o-succinylbenzoate--CoA ligase [Sphingobium chlorophenolicum L-1]